MAKTRTMRVAVLLLALTLITSCFVGGTFAKYITNGEATDSARVAKWGVVVEAFDGSNFKTEYINTDSILTVSSSTGDKLVAPGTADTEGVTFKISGTPEVATKATVDMAVNSDVYLNYSDNGEGKTYNPVVFTLSVKDGNGNEADWAVAATGTLADIEEFLENEYATNGVVNFKANEVLDAEYKLTWAWDFGTAGAATGNDVLDTALGDLAADPTATINSVAVTGFNTTIDYSINITIEQVD